MQGARYVERRHNELCAHAHRPADRPAGNAPAPSAECDRRTDEAPHMGKKAILAIHADSDLRLRRRCLSTSAER